MSFSLMTFFYSTFIILNSLAFDIFEISRRKNAIVLF